MSTQEQSAIAPVENTAPPTIDRQVKVFSPPKNAQQQAQVPETFYKLDGKEIASLYKAQVAYRQQLEDAAKQNHSSLVFINNRRPLKTQKMRQLEEQEKMKRYPKTTIRVRLPDLTLLQATFESKEKVGVLYEFLGSTLATPDRAFLLCLPPRIKLTDPSITLYKAGLAPASNLTLVWLKPGSVPGSVLSSTYMAMIQPLETPSLAPVADSSAPTKASSSSSQPKPKPIPTWLKKGLFKNKK
ncbi:hypothetical protein DM01DRAFT_1067226 [Hesseltinella vesiculosa]|uniref:UBX domain-containing protein n=1 Tax=Hesseltinella vesiculosa TaxID=101127 RepID=A0A1X2GV13_9FUNG|nr:hypothetical protein DM01DRAFT_1067226 [Hesseltinella vesiculosa]